MSAEHASSSGDAPSDWALVLQTHSGWLRAVIHSRLRNRDETDEVMQEVLCAAVKSELRASECESVQAWLYRTAIRQVTLFRRREGRQKKRIADFARQKRHEPDDGPLQWLLSQEAQSHLRIGLDQLRDNDRLILILKYSEDWSCNEIAKRFGLTETTVQTRLLRARKRLRTILANIEND